jgi:HK97 family phage major capsid protein
MGKPEAQLRVKSLTLKGQLSTKEVEGERRIVFVASSSQEDRDYEHVDVKSLRLPTKGGGEIKVGSIPEDGTDLVDVPFMLNHSFDVTDVIGSVRRAYYDSNLDELVFEAGISSRGVAQEMLTLIEEGHLSNAMSITMIDFDYNWDSGLISNAEVIEVSLVFRGSNKEARLLTVKSLLKGEHMSDKDKQTPTPDPDADKPVVDAPAPTPDEPVEDAPAPADAPADQPAPEGDTDAPAGGDDAPADEDQPADDEPVEPVEDKPNPEKETNKMSEIDTEAAKQVKDKATAPKQAPKQKDTMSERDKKILTIKQIRAMLQKNHSEVERLNKIAVENDMSDAEVKAWKQKAIDYDEGATLYLAEQLDTDVDRQLENVGNVGAIVTRRNLTVSPKYRRIVRTDGVRFMKPGFIGTKGEDAPTWTSFILEPKPYAVIIGINDHAAEDAYVNVYNELVQDIAEAEAYLEDETILIEDGATVADGTVYPVQGLVPLLTTASRVTAIASYGSEDVIPALGAAYGALKGRGVITLVANTVTWGRLATSMDANNHPIFTVVGQQVSAGALGTFNVVLSDVLEDGQVVIGRFANYVLAFKEGLQLLESKHATVGDVNAFTEDFTFLRAVKRIEGGTPRINTFQLLEFATASS